MLILAWVVGVQVLRSVLPSSEGVSHDSTNFGFIEAVEIFPLADGAGAVVAGLSGGETGTCWARACPVEIIISANAVPIKAILKWIFRNE